MEVQREVSKTPEGTGPRSKGGGWERKMFNCSILPHGREDVRSKAPIQWKGGPRRGFLCSMAREVAIWDLSAGFGVRTDVQTGPRRSAEGVQGG